MGEQWHVLGRAGMQLTDEEHKNEGSDQELHMLHLKHDDTKDEHGHCAHDVSAGGMHVCGDGTYRRSSRTTSWAQGYTLT